MKSINKEKRMDDLSPLDDAHYEEYEKEFHEENRRAYKKERKFYEKKDRSQYKKTDVEKKKAPPPIDGEKGRVISISLGQIVVQLDSNQPLICSLKGSLKSQVTRQKNIIAIGDRVVVEKKGKEGVIGYIEPRQTILTRASIREKRKQQIIAANIDRVFITVSTLSPRLKPALIDRYIIAANKGKMMPIVVINKMDLIGEDVELKELINELLQLYKKIGIACYPLSAKTGEGIEPLKKAMEQHTCVFSGQSGTGKTSLINLLTESKMAVQEVSSQTEKGRHTTTMASLIPLTPSGFCIDTPGIKSFGLWEISMGDLCRYFSDFFPCAKECQYQNCRHRNEQICGVKKGVEEGKISTRRYQSYLALMEEVENGKNHSY